MVKSLPVTMTVIAASLTVNTAPAIIAGPVGASVQYPSVSNKTAAAITVLIQVRLTINSTGVPLSATSNGIVVAASAVNQVLTYTLPFGHVGGVTGTTWLTDQSGNVLSGIYNIAGTL